MGTCSTIIRSFRMFYTARSISCLFFIISLAALTSCSAAKSKLDLKRDLQIPAAAKQPKKESVPLPEPAVPDFSPASDDISPLKTRIVDITARNTPLRDVLLIISEACGLNLAMENGVDPEYPVSMVLRNLTAEEALKTIFSSVDYMYTFAGNMLFVKAVDTRIFELGFPSVTQTYKIDVGGNILGGSGSSGSTLKGDVSQQLQADDKALKLWDTIDENLKTFLAERQSVSSRRSAKAEPARKDAPAASSEKSKEPNTADAKTPSEYTPVVELADKHSYTINRLTGTISVTASKKVLDRIDQYLSTVKKVLNRQVLIEAKIIEVELSDSLKFGIDWSVFENWKDLKLNVSTGNFASPLLASGQPLISAAMSGTNFSTLITALAEQGEVRTLSNPRISMMNGQTSLLSVGRNQSYLSKVTTSTSTSGTNPITTYTTETTSVLSGVMLGLVTYINETGEISINVTPIISDLVKFDEKSFGQGNSISIPTIDLKEMNTTVKVRDGEMVVIGGLISRKEGMKDGKVPFLGDIPLLGYLFTKKEKEDSRRELVVVLQPHIISK